MATKRISRSLGAFVEFCGTQGKAAKKIGVSRVTVNNWLTKRTRPMGPSLRILSQLNIDTTTK